MTRAELRALCDAATPGPWTLDELPRETDGNGTPISYDVMYCAGIRELAECVRTEDAEFICTARTALPELLGREARLVRLLVEAAGTHGDPCPGDCDLKMRIRKELSRDE